MFLAIAVDNLANAQILTEDEEKEKQEREQMRALNKRKYTNKGKGKGWSKAGAKIPVVMAFNHMVRKRNGHATPAEADPPITTWYVISFYEINKILRALWLAQNHLP